MLLSTICSCVAIVLISATSAQAADFTFTVGTAGTGRAGKIEFTNLGGNNLQVVLTNIGGDVLAPVDVLTAVFFNCSCGTLTPVSATLTAGSTVFFDSAPAGGNVGGEWGYGAGLAGPGGATRGISSAGFGLFGDANFGGPNLDGPDGLNGLNYGLLSSSDDTSTGNAAVTGNFPYIKSSVTFVLSGYTGGTVTSNTFSNLSFQYGTALDEPNIGGGTGGGSGQNLVPEPTSLLLFGSGLAMTAYRARRKKEQRPS